MRKARSGKTKDPGSVVQPSAPRLSAIQSEKRAAGLFSAFKQPACALALALALAGCGGQSTQLGPRTILEQYVTAIEADKPARAYELLHDSVRRKISRSEFILRWKQLRQDLLTQARDIRARLSRTLEISAKLIYPTGIRADLVTEGGNWYIEGGLVLVSSTKTPQDTIRAFVMAVEQRNFPAVMKLMTAATRERVEQELNDRLTRLKDRLGREIEVDGDRIQLQYGPRFSIELIREDGQWRIHSLD